MQVTGEEGEFPLDVDSAEFWAAVRRRQLIVQRCTSCQQARWPPRSACPHCTTMSHEWVTASGRGRLESWTDAAGHTKSATSRTLAAWIRLSDHPGCLLLGKVEVPAQTPLTAGLEVVAIFVSSDAHGERDPDGTGTGAGGDGDDDGAGDGAGIGSILWRTQSEVEPGPQPAPQPQSAAGTVSSAEDLRGIYGRPSARVVAMHRPALDRFHIAYIESSPLVMIATADVHAVPAVSPRGGDPGFVQVLDQETLFLADRPGNNTLRSMRNLLENDQIALVFLVPGVDEVCRVEGTARVIDQRAEDFADLFPDRSRTGLVITVHEAYLHCGKALRRARAWDAEAKVPAGTVPSLGRAIVETLQDDSLVVAEVEATIAQRYLKEL